MKKMKANGKKKWILLGILFSILTACFAVRFGDTSMAADEMWIEVDGNRLASDVAFEMRDKTLQLKLGVTGNSYADTSKYRVEWSILYEQSILSVQGVPANQTMAIATALSPGTATVTVTVFDATTTDDTILNSATCKINVVFAIDTSGDDTKYKYVFEDSLYRSLVLYSGENVPLRLNYGNAEDAQWISNNEEVATIGIRTGVLTAMGAGRTRVIATYRPEGSDVEYSATLDVYVVPRVTDNAKDHADGIFQNALTSKMDNQNYIYTDAYFSSNNVEPLQDKLTWVIKKDVNGQRVVIADSLGKTSPLIQLKPLSSSSNTYQVEAKAGKYYIYFYAAGTYVSESRCMENPTRIDLTVYANFGDLNEVLQIGDVFSVAEALNVTLEDFQKMFRIPVLTIGGMDAQNYAEYDQTTGRVTTKRKGVVKVTLTPSNRSGVEELLNPNTVIQDPTNLSLTITLNIIDYFYLDRNAVTLLVGQSLQLVPITTNEFKQITWTTSDNRYVTVDENTGLIKGIRETTSLTSDVVITATMDMGNGHYPQAVCYVKVEPTISGVTLDPTELTLRVGENATVSAKLNQSVSVAPLNWQSLNTDVFTVSPANDNKSAVISAKKGGEAYLTVTNTMTSNLMANLKVRVVILIDSITFTAGNITDDLFRGGRQIAYTVKPTDANTNDLIWSSANTDIATVSENGYVTYKSAGTVLISASSKSNMSASASFYLTIRQSATSIDVQPKSVSVEVGKTSQLTCVLTPNNSMNHVTWTSSDATIATVSQSGLVTAKKAGKTLIWAAAEGLNAPVSSEVTVTQASTGISFLDKEIVLASGQTYGPPATAITPSDSTDSLTWNSLDPEVVKVDGNGVLTGVKAGSTYLQVKTGSGYDAVIPVHVRDYVKGLKLSKETATLQVGEAFNLDPVFTPEKPYDTGVTWTSSDTGVATVQEGSAGTVVTGVKAGVAMITCTSKDGGYQAYCLVTVNDRASYTTPTPPPTSSAAPTTAPTTNPAPPPTTTQSTEVSLNHTNYYLPLGKSVKLNATVKSAAGTTNSVKWTTSNKKVAAVNGKGKVTGKKIGKATIRAKAKDGSGASATCTIRVVRRVSKISLSRTQLKLLDGVTYKLKATVKPSNATVKKVKWSSGDKDIATVDAGGRITTLQPGLVKITAKTTDGSNKSAFCLLTVRERVASTGITVSEPDIVIVKGSSVQTGMSVEPENSTDALSYSSDNPKVASVNGRGKIMGLAIGSATIYASTPEGHSGSVNVMVVGMNRRTATMKQYDTQTLWVNDVDTDVKWYSKNPGIATVVDGKVVARKKGTTTVYAVVKGTRVPCRIRVTKLK